MNIREMLIGLGIEPEKAIECEKSVITELYKDFIPKGQYNKKIEELKTLEEKVKGLEVNKNNENNKKNENEEKDDILKKLLEKVEKMEKDREVDVLNVKKEQIKSELIKKGMNEQMVDLILKNNELAGTNEEVISNITSEYKDFIPATEVKGKEPSNNNLKTNTNNDNTYTKDDLARMSEEDLNSLIEEDPNFFDKITY